MTAQGMTFDSIPYTGSRMDASLKLGQQIADAWGVNALMIQMARDITKRWNTRSRMDEANAIQGWINRRVRYVPDPHGAEMMADPVTTIKNGGDCDDMAILAAALLQAIGHDARIAAVTWEGRTDASHAVALDLTAGCVVDPTVSINPGEWPPLGYKVQALKFIDKAGQMQTMNGWFSKIVKAVAKPFQKIFPAKTLLGKVMDPLGLTDPKRNLNLVGRVADVVGTAAALAVGGYAIGAAAGATTSGFWATSAAGGKIAAGAAWHALSSVGGAVGTAAKTVLPVLLAGAASGGGAAQAQAAPAGSTGYYDPNAGAGQGVYDATAGYAASGGGGGGGAYTLPDGTPGATVPVNGSIGGIPPALLIAGGVAALLLITSNKKRRVTHVSK